MPNRNLTQEELDSLFYPFIEDIRANLIKLSSNDSDLLWALRRKLYKELTYDERGKPAFRKKLKEIKRAEQNNKCPLCHLDLPWKNAVLDRLKAMDGYTEENTRLICPECDYKTQKERGFA